ncbi:hypothetical protein BGZ94_004686 [Podila epigama]|nr:hypothetical protein BGZ94_004686 [Podila epigama]
MDSNSACAMPWIDAAVSRFVTNPPPFNTSTATPHQFQLCCTDENNCVYGTPLAPSLTVCTFGTLLCTVGNSAYACRFVHGSTHNGAGGGGSGSGEIIPLDTPTSTIIVPPPSPPNGRRPVCFQEGTLADKRNTPCCKHQLTTFLRSPQAVCIDAYGAFESHSTACCNTNNGTSSCQWMSHAGGIGGGLLPACGSQSQRYFCQGGENTAVCWGKEQQQQQDGKEGEECVLQVPLAELSVTPSCYPPKATTSGADDGSCVLGSGLDGQTPITAPTTKPGEGKPLPTQKTNGGMTHRITLKTLCTVACIVVPLFQQLFF